MLFIFVFVDKILLDKLDESVCVIGSRAIGIGLGVMLMVFEDT
jgi:hypothetical protein